MAAINLTLTKTERAPLPLKMDFSGPPVIGLCNLGLPLPCRYLQAATRALKLFMNPGSDCKNFFPK
jgi:hypothetical protein